MANRSTARAKAAAAGITKKAPAKAVAAKKKGRKKPMPARSNKGGLLRGKARAAVAKTYGH